MDADTFPLPLDDEAPPRIADRQRKGARLVRVILLLVALAAALVVLARYR